MLLGHYFAWSMKDNLKSVEEIANALEKVGLDRKEALPMASADAFSRACKKLAKARVIRKLKTAKGEEVRNVRFQFTKEIRDKIFTYDFEAVLELDKEIGVVTCEEKPELAALAQTELNKCIIVRTGNDTTRLIRRLFKKNAHLFNCEECFGLYFVPTKDLEFVDQIEKFVNEIGGKTKRIPVNDDAEGHGRRSVAKDIKGGLQEKIDKHKEAIEALDLSSRDDTIERRLEAIKLTKLEIESFREYLLDNADKLVEALDDSKKMLRAKMEEIHKDRHKEDETEEAMKGVEAA